MSHEQQPQESTKPAAASKQPVSIVANDDGSVVITNAAGKVKRRKGQPEEAYAQQLDQFYAEGPPIQKQDWLIEAYEAEHAKYKSLLQQFPINSEEKDNNKRKVVSQLTLFNVLDKPPKHQLIHTAENQYYRRNYEKSIEVCDTLLGLFELYGVVLKNKREIEEVTEIKRYSEKKIIGK